MFPVTLDTSRLNMVLAGQDTPALHRRLRLLDEAGAKHVQVCVPDAGDILRKQLGSRLTTRLPETNDLQNAEVLMVVDVTEAEAKLLYTQGKAAGALVNVEDVRELCDFHFAGTVRRGDLLFTISTGGASPALARILREWLEDRFPARWAETVQRLGQLRLGWKKEGKNASQITKETQQWLQQEGLLDIKEKAA